jgi:hypothetical protein
MTDERNISLTEEEIRELIANEFPRLITQNPEIRYELIGVMSETFAKKRRYNNDFERAQADA